MSGDEVGLFSEPEVTHTLTRFGGWDLDSLDSYAHQRLIGDLLDNFSLGGYPELKNFK